MRDTPDSAVEAASLDLCAAEAIHLPGSIQPHGVLLAFTLEGALDAWSENAGGLLGVSPVAGCRFEELALPAEVSAALSECIGDGVDPSPIALATSIDGQQFDVIIHRHAGHMIAEFESREESSDKIAQIALEAHRVNDRLRRQHTATALLELAVEQVRRITGFDRVMAYRFRPDDSGDVVAESRAATLAPYLGLRFPASDIPVQARRLYAINTLRLIPDTHYVPVPLQGRALATPLDMSHCALRSVSPVHIEYLLNMGVAASMSVSILINGRLWGLLACHHTQARKVPYLIRMACDVLAHVIAAAIQSLDAVAIAEHAVATAQTRLEFLETLFDADDVMTPLTASADALRSLFAADAAIICHGAKLLTFGDIPPAVATAVRDSLPTVGAELLERTREDEWPERSRPSLCAWFGMLGLCFDPPEAGWLLLLRTEHLETVRWSGNPEKQISVGPRGPRLTPRASFEAWQESVRVVEPWTRVELVNARQLLGEVHRARNVRQTGLDQTRNQLLAMLGHDLRDPLNSISMAATVLTRGDVEQKLGNRILASSARMQRLINQVLDVSRVQNGLGLGVTRVPVNLSSLIADIVDETQTAHPQTRLEMDVPPQISAVIDSDRIAQVLSNLLNNARHHGSAGTAVFISLRADRERLIIRVRNEGAPIDPERAANLYDPFKRPALLNVTNRSGLGLGLYIARAIVTEHEGTILYAHESPHVVFTVELPCRRDYVADGVETDNPGGWTRQPVP